MTGKSLRHISQIISVATIALFLWYFLANLKDFSALLHLNPLFLVVLLVAYAASIFANSLFMMFSIELFDKKMDFAESVKVTLISTTGNFFAPIGSGVGFRAIYLKKLHDLSYASYIAIVFCNYVFVFFINAVLGLTALYLLRSQFNPSLYVLLGLFLAILAVCVLLVLVSIKQNRNPKEKLRSGFRGKVNSAVKSVSEGWSILLSDRSVALYLLGVMVVNTLITIVATYLIFLTLGITLSPGGILLFSVLGSFSVFINITPANLGIKEAVFLAFSSAVGLGPVQILSFTLIDRVITFVVLSLMWLFFGRRSLVNMTRKLKVKETIGAKD